jgi:hypothetical protein
MCGACVDRDDALVYQFTRRIECVSTETVRVCIDTQGVWRVCWQGRCASVSIRRAGTMCECIDTPCRDDVRVYRYAVQGRCASVSIRRAGTMCECIDTPCRGDVRVYRYAVQGRCASVSIRTAYRACIDRAMRVCVCALMRTAYRLCMESTHERFARLRVDCVYGTMRGIYDVLCSFIHRCRLRVRHDARCPAAMRRACSARRALSPFLSRSLSPALSLPPSLPSEAGSERRLDGPGGARRAPMTHVPHGGGTAAARERCVRERRQGREREREKWRERERE